MFWNKDKKSQKGANSKTADKRGKAAKSQACVGSNKDAGHGSNRDAIHAQAMANVRSARAHIGEETLDKIAAAMTKKQQSAMEQAKRQIQGADVDKVLDELKFMLDTKDA